MPGDGVASIARSSTSDDIIDDLEKDKVISRREDKLSIQLTNESLIVKGVKQPEEIHQEILKKHMTKAGDKIRLLYNTQ